MSNFLYLLAGIAIGALWYRRHIRFYRAKLEVWARACQRNSLEVDKVFYNYTVEGIEPGPWERPTPVSTDPKHYGISENP